MEERNETYGVIQGARVITRSIADKNILNGFLHDFSPTFNSLMRDKKYLFIECEGFKWVHIYDNDEQLAEMYSKQTNIEEEDDDECFVEQITKEIGYNEFLKMANGTQMDFERYSTLDSDLIFDFDEEA